MKFKFTKMHGLGNNYIYVNQFEEKLPEEILSSLAKRVANVQTGIGSDGLILIAPSDKAEIKMRVFNSDGSEAKNCGNGLRCVARFAYDNGLTDKASFDIETLGGLVRANLDVEDNEVKLVTIDMGVPRLTKGSLPMKGNPDELATNSSVLINNEEVPFVGVSMGNPHAVIFV